MVDTSKNHFVNLKKDFVEYISYLCHLIAKPSMIYLDKILTESDLRQYLSFMIDKLGWGFHPDTPVGDYIDNNGNPSYTIDEIPILDRLIDESFDYCEANNLDIYEISMAILNEKFGDIFEELHKAYSEANA